MSNITEFFIETENQLEILVSLLKSVKPGDLGLDDRAAYNLYIDESCIVVSKDCDGRLQYYGGFEYVDKSERKEYGNWVFYFNGDDRVHNHLRHYYDMENSK